MITYRHHIASLVAVFLALAVGIALGGGPLSELGRNEATTPAKVVKQSESLERSASFADAFATASAEKLYAGGLREHPVSILAMPDADTDTLAALVDQVGTAGGTVTGTFEVAPALVDPMEKSLIDTLGTQLVTQVGSGAVDAEASTYDRMGQLLGLALATTRETAQPAGDAANAVRQSLVGAELMTSPEDEPRTAPLVLVVLGAGQPAGDAENAVLSGLVSGLAATALGVVVVADADSGTDGALAGLRAEPGSQEVSTLDGVDSPLGQVSAVLALLRELAGSGGSFGASGADGAVPLG